MASACTLPSASLITASGSGTANWHSRRQLCIDPASILARLGKGSRVWYNSHTISGKVPATQIDMGEMPSIGRCLTKREGAQMAGETVKNPEQPSATRAAPAAGEYNPFVRGRFPVGVRTIEAFDH